MKTENPFKVYEQLFLTPKLFFKAVAKETDAVTIAVFVGLFLFAGKVFELAAWIPTLAIHSDAAYLPTIMLSVLGSLVSPLLTLLATLFVACLVHLGVSYYKKGTSFFSTWKVLVYATLIPIVYSVSMAVVQTIAESVNPWPDQSLLAASPVWGPYSLLISGLLFLVVLVTIIHTIYTEAVGLKEYHKLTTAQALVAIIVPLLILILFVLLLLVLFGSFFMLA